MGTLLNSQEETNDEIQISVPKVGDDGLQMPECVYPRGPGRAVRRKRWICFGICALIVVALALGFGLGFGLSRKG